jgi:8-oxo-dGTP pyrophosphatase MutT (NUDIX family)
VSGESTSNRKLRDLIRQRLDGSQPAPPEQVSVPGTLGDLPHRLRRIIPRRLTAAAVLIPLVDRPEGLSVVLTKRAAHLKHHGGQISFPGGRLEHNDAGPAAAALRETNEEIGLESERVEVVGFLNNYLTITGYSVTPVVGLVRPGFSLEIDQEEVEEAFEVPLAYLFDKANALRHEKRFLGIRVPYYEIPYLRHKIWGATAGMLVSFRMMIFEEDVS